MSETLKAYYGDVGSFKLLTKQQEKTLAQKIEKGDNQARDLMISSNLRLALSIANKYKQTGFPMEDIIQEANIGLIKAVDRFDHKKGFRFSTYACWWIRQSIRRYLAIQGHIKFPAGSRHMIWKINNFRKEYEEEFNEMPSNSEVADYLGIKESQVEDLRTGMQWPINIDSPVGGVEGGRTYADMIEDEDSPNIDMEIDAKKMMSLIREAFSSLKPQEEQVLRLRFGITEDDNNPQYKVS
ncbi:MAG: hypothetical protein CBC29_07010 [Methylococcaceae bacterium TMED69]|nr:MAG: hypothetical protein CBC29_07010 [Methylococcaceae bacterium TMED69]|tara:strand:+ start:901 stop:1620 length:720 start_codon:yes stop_codon:yes gene_type:complete